MPLPGWHPHQGHAGRDSSQSWAAEPGSLQRPKHDVHLRPPQVYALPCRQVTRVQMSHRAKPLPLPVCCVRLCLASPGQAAACGAWPCCPRGPRPARPCADGDTDGSCLRYRGGGGRPCDRSPSGSSSHRSELSWRKRSRGSQGAREGDSGAGTGFTPRIQSWKREAGGASSREPDSQPGLGRALGSWGSWRRRRAAPSHLPPRLSQNSPR